MRRHLALVAALVAALIIVPTAGARVIGPQPRQGSCGAASGALPDVTSVTVDGTTIPDADHKGGAGTLYYSIDDNGGTGQLNGSDCLYRWDVSLRRVYDVPGAPSDGRWFTVAGLGSWFLDHAAFARKFDGSYTESPAVTEDSTVVITADLPASGSYAGSNAYWYTSTGRLEGDRAIVVEGNTLTVTGHPAPYVMTPETWPTGLPSSFNALTDADPGYGGAFPGGSPNGFNDSGPFGDGGSIAQVAARGLSFSFATRFAATLARGSEEQRGMWFETIDTPRWTIMYGRGDDGSPALTFGMGNYHQYYDEANTPTLNTGSLRVMLPDAWTALGFGVTSASDPLLIQGAIKVVRQENGSGASAPVLATTRAVSGVGIIVDIGTVHFSLPNFKTQRNTAVKAARQGRKVKLTFSLTKAQAKKAITIWAGSKKLKKVATLRKAKKGKNTVLVAYKRGYGFAVKAGTTLIGSATVSG